MHSMSWVNYLKFLFEWKFMLIDYLTLNYMFAYFWFVIWLCYQFLIHSCSEDIFRKHYFSETLFFFFFCLVFFFFFFFFPFLASLCEASGRTWLEVQTRAALPITDLAICRPDELVTCSDAGPRVIYPSLSPQAAAPPSLFHFLFVFCAVFSSFLVSFWLLCLFLHFIISFQVFLLLPLFFLKVLKLFRILDYLFWNIVEI